MAARRKVVVAMSGGVDSSVAACLLHEQGYDVTGLFMRTGTTEVAACATECAGKVDRQDARPTQSASTLGAGPTQSGLTQSGLTQSANSLPEGGGTHRGCCSAVDASDARAVAGRLGVPFFALNFKDAFDRIIDYFVAEYERGRTPNPCVMCNEHLKFGRLAEYGAAVGADYVATGHYARIEQQGGQWRLMRGIDTAKDQSYVLFGIGRERLAHTLLPIGGMSKAEVREHARRFGLPLAEKPDSQDICFVPDRDYARVVRERKPEAFRPGVILDASGREIGRHEGIANFTIGQRRGLGIAMGLPVYVTRIDPATDTVTIGPREHLTRDTLNASDVRWLSDAPAGAFRAAVKIRYAHTPAAATVEPLAADRVQVHFDEPQAAITPGQAAVFYNGDVVLGGGWID